MKEKDVFNFIQKYAYILVLCPLMLSAGLTVTTWQFWVWAFGISFAILLHDAAIVQQVLRAIERKKNA